MPSRAPTFVALFSGGGGFTRGFAEAGFQPVLCSDIAAHAEKTHNLNWPDVEFIRQDIRHIDAYTIIDQLAEHEVDVLIGGPPCQGFTNMGDKFSGDDRNFLISDYIRIISVLNPSFVLTENVPGIVNRYGGYFFRLLSDGLIDLGYQVSYDVLDSSSYGVPQIRKRAFILAARIPWKPLFPKPGHVGVGNLKPNQTVGEAIHDLPEYSNGIPNHLPLEHSEKVIARYRLIPEGGKLPSPELLPPEIRRGNFGNTYQRLARNKPATTMVPGNNAFPIHPVFDRSLTPREAARIQSFPDSHQFAGNRAEQCQLVGSAVPPLLAARFAQLIRTQLEGRSPDGREAHAYGCQLTMRPIMRGPANHDKKQLTFVDIFSGAGGFTVGLTQAGLTPLACADMNDYCREIHLLNHPEIPFVHGDLSKRVVQNELVSKVGECQVDVLVGGPPCQGFSIFGKRRFVNTRGHDPKSDKRNDLIRAYCDIVGRLNPTWVIFENVPGFTSLSNGAYLRYLVRRLENLGYNKIDSKILNAASFGVPQDRRRFLLIAHRGQQVIPWPREKFFAAPKGWQKPYRGVWEVLSELAKKTPKGKFSNHISPNHHKIVAERFSFIPEGGNLEPSILPARLKKGLKTGVHVKKYSKIFKRLHRGQPSPTLVPGHNAFPIHPTLNRTLTIREAARIQTFPDWVQFAGPIIEQGRQVGNAFPPLLAQTLGERLLRVVRNGWTPATITKLALYSMIGNVTDDEAPSLLNQK